MSVLSLNFYKLIKYYLPTRNITILVVLAVLGNVIQWVYNILIVETYDIPSSHNFLHSMFVQYTI